MRTEDVDKAKHLRLMARGGYSLPFMQPCPSCLPTVLPSTCSTHNMKIIQVALAPLVFSRFAEASIDGRLRGKNPHASSNGELLTTGPQLLGSPQFPAKSHRSSTPTGSPTEVDQDIVIPPVDPYDDDRPCNPTDCPPTTTHPIGART